MSVHGSNTELPPPIDEDELQMARLGHTQSLHRSWSIVESFAASFCSLNFIAGVRSLFFLGILAGGPAAMWSSYLITMAFMFITAAVLAEICSAMPLSGSIYIWAAESAGLKYSRLVGFTVAWWACTSWISVVASNCQITTTYIVSQLAVWEIEFPGGNTSNNIKWRAFIWAISEALLVVACGLTYLPPRWYSRLFRFSIGLIMLDFFLSIIWLPIAVSRTYGFRSAHDVFTQTYNGTGAPAGWNWILSILFAAATLIGFDSSGHIAEETKHASVTSARGIFFGAVATGVFGFITTILFLFCTPDLETLFSLSAPQPFVQIYALALGRKSSAFMTSLAALEFLVNTSIIIVAASRLIFAVARDGVLPLSWWISQVGKDGQPRHAVTVVFIVAALLLCSILPSTVAFTSLVSAGGLPLVASYGLIGLMRLTQTRTKFHSTRFSLGSFSTCFYAATAISNALIFAVVVSPFFFPVTAANFNFACVIFVAVTIIAVLCWWFVPEDRWLQPERLRKVGEGAAEPGI